MKRHAAPIIAAILLLLPVLYVGSYLALVKPRGLIERKYLDAYRYGTPQSDRLFYPLETIDRKLRPRMWKERNLNPQIPASPRKSGGDSGST